MAIIDDKFVLKLENLRTKLRNILLDKKIYKEEDEMLENLIEAVKELSSENCLNDFLNGDLTSYVNNEVTSIRAYCFYGNTKLEKVRLDNVLKLNTACFNGCTNFKHLLAPKLQRIESGTSNIIQGTLIENIILPELMSFSDWYTFSVASLRRLIIPKCTTVQPHQPLMDNTVKLMDCMLCFERTQLNLETYICRSTSTIPKLSNADYIKNIQEIYVTEKIIEQFKTATNWSVYADKIKPIEGSKYENLDWYKNEQWYAKEMSVWE